LAAASDAVAAVRRAARSRSSSACHCSSDKPTALPLTATATVQQPECRPSNSPGTVSSTLTTRHAGHTPSSRKLRYIAIGAGRPGLTSSALTQWSGAKPCAASKGATASMMGV